MMVCLHHLLINECASRTEVYVEGPVCGVRTAPPKPHGCYFLALATKWGYSPFIIWASSSFLGQEMKTQGLELWEVWPRGRHEPAEQDFILG